MYRRLFTVGLLGVLASASLADPPKITGETKVAPFKLVRLKVENLPDKAVPLWKVRPADPKNSVDWYHKSYQVKEPIWVAPPGEYRVEATWGRAGTDGELLLDYAEVLVTIVSPGPPPGPSPSPNPPVPTPDPTAPISKPGLRVLFVRESDANAMNALTRGQREVLMGEKVRDYLRGKCATEPENPNGAWRILDPDVNPLANGDPDGPTWAAALKRPRASIPWVLVSNGTRNVGYEGPLPADTNADKFIEFMKKYE